MFLSQVGTLFVKNMLKNQVLIWSPLYFIAEKKEETEIQIDWKWL